MSSKLYKFLPERTILEVNIAISLYTLAIELSDISSPSIIKIY